VIEVPHSQNRSESTISIGRMICWAASILLAMLVLDAPVATAVTPADTAATLALLQADYELDSVLLHNAAASKSAAVAFAQNLGRECHGVLKGAPNDEGSQREQAPRARGEHQRSEIQLNEIEDEISRAAYAASYQPDRAAYETYIAKVEQLEWSNPEIGALIGFRAADYREDLTPLTANLCADMEAWAQSGFHLLSPATKAIEATQEARSEQARPKGSIDALLKADEGPAEQALLKRLHALEPRVLKALAGVEKAYPSLEQALGLPASPIEATRGKVLRRGTTKGGEAFIVRLEQPGNARDPHCRVQVSVELTKTSKPGASFDSDSSVCVSDHSGGQPSLGCGSGESIELAVPPSVRTVRLLLSNGRTVTSRVVLVPGRHADPGGVYVQSIRGYKPFPVSLTELDAHGKTVRVVKLAKSSRCRPQPAVQGPQFIDIAHGTTPEGEPFTIQGVLVHNGGQQPFFSLSVGADHETGQAEETVSGHTAPKAFERSLAYECAPHAYSIVYGILAPPGDSVLVRTAEGLVALTKVELAANLNSGGPLLYGAFKAAPSELIVRRADGSTLYTESLLTAAREEAEFCEGYAEG
jgi:hypothetical protein